MLRSRHRALRHRLFWSGSLLALWLCFGPVASAFAVEKTLLQDMVLRNWDLDDGLPSARINGVARTSDGYLWLATHKGLVRFDGTRFVVFDTSNSPGMEDDRVSCLLLDRRGDLWAGTYAGTLLKLVGQAFRVQDLRSAALSPKEKGVAEGKVNDLAEDSRGALWLALEGRGLLRFHNGQAAAFSTNSGLPSVDVRRVLCDSGGRLWVVAGGQLGLFESGRWRGPSGLPPESQTVRTISAARDGGLWVATGTVDPLASRDLRLFKLKEGIWSAQLEPYPWPQDSQQFQRLALLEDESGRVWCAAAGSVFFRSPAGSWQRLSSATPGVQVEVLCLAEDENGLLWMGTRTTGLLQAQKRQATTHSLPAFARQHAVLTACSSKDGSVWCGTDGAGIFRWQADQITPFGSDQGLTNLHVAALLEDRRTNLWAGTDGGLFRRVGERFERAPGPPALREPILALLEDRQGNLWTGGRAGLVRLNAAGGRLFGAEEGLFGGAVRALAEGRDGRIWVGPNAGLYWLDGEKFQYYPVPQEPHLQGIFALHCDTSGSLWIGTDLAGLLRFRADYFDQWLWSRDGLPSNHLTAILEDDQGDLWISSENGIFGCSKPELDKYQRGLTAPLRPRRLTPAEGLAQKVCSGVGQPSACKSADGRLWFPNGPALVVFDPTTIPRTLRVRPPLIEGVSVDGVPVALDADGLRLRAGARRIDFQYASPNVLAPERLRFRFRLDGLDKAWVEVGSRREASYSQLPPGAYQFTVQVSGPENSWQEAVRGLPLEILPRFWERRSVQLAAGLVLLASVTGVAWAGERSRSRRRLERLELQRTLDAERQRIARDIHDDLGSGLTEIILLSDSLDEAIQPTPADQKMVGEISARARSLTRAMDEVVWAINPRNDTLEGFLTYLGKFTQDYLTKADVRCRWNVPLDVPDLPLSADMRHSLYLACKEALHNIVKHARASEVSVRLDLAKGAFTLAIEDDGQGFAAGVPQARGNGLSNMRKRLEDLHGLCRVESAPGRGTRVLFSLSCALGESLSS
jgi:ligand-binding sensor domain-containing protein/signal transduction histidine kinase